MVWSWSSIATTSKSSLVPPRYHCPTIGLITFIAASVCYARLHSTPNESFTQYVNFARSNIDSDRTAHQILRGLFRRGRPHLADPLVCRPYAGCERPLQEKNGRQIDGDRARHLRDVRVGGREISGYHGNFLKLVPHRRRHPAFLDCARH